MAKPNELVKKDEFGIPLEVPNFEGWVDEQVGFAPYWNPEEGKWLYARVIARDERDPSFVRYLMQAGMDTECHRGAEGEAVKVKRGEHFTISVYFSLRDLFDLYLETGIRPFIKVLAVKEVPTKTTGRNVWTWKVQVSPDDKKMIDAKKKEILLMQQRSDAEEFPPKQISS